MMVGMGFGFESNRCGLLICLMMGDQGFIARLSLLRRAFKRVSHYWSIEMGSTT